MNCIVIDDDEVARLSVRHCIEKTDFLKFCGAYSSVAESLKAIHEQQTDLVFLDVEMPEMSGLDFLKTFRDIPQIILITGKKEYAAEAFDHDVTDFVLKPVEYPRFLKAANKALIIHQNMEGDPEHDALFVKKEGGRLIRISARDVLYVEALADYVNIHTKEGRHTLLATMKSIEAKLPPREFVRIHRSFIVRLDKISEIEENSVNVAGKAIPVSRSHKEDLFKRLRLL